MSEPEHRSAFLLIWSCQQSPAGSLSALTAVYLPRGNSLYATTTPRAAKLVSRGLHSWPSKPLVSCWGVQDAVRHVKFCASIPSVITAVAFLRLTNAAWGTHSLSFLSLHVLKGLAYFDSYTNTAYREWWQTQDWITRNAAWRDQFLSVEGALLEAWSSKRMKALVCEGWYWLFGLHFECSIIC